MRGAHSTGPSRISGRRLDAACNDVMFRRNNVMLSTEQLVCATCDALARGDVAPHELTARQLGARLGKTTSVLYHHWGSLDGFLFAVGQRGFARLAREVLGELQRDGGLEAIAEAFVRFGLDQPVLYHVMFERDYDWAALRAAGAFEGEMPGMTMWSSLIGFLAGAGSADPQTDARILYAGMHGLVSLANSGRANIGDHSVSDRDAAMAAARKLARRIAATPRGEP